MPQRLADVRLAVSLCWPWPVLPELCLTVLTGMPLSAGLASQQGNPQRVGRSRKHVCWQLPCCHVDMHKESLGPWWVPKDSAPPTSGLFGALGRAVSSNFSLGVFLLSGPLRPDLTTVVLSPRLTSTSSSHLCLLTLCPGGWGGRASSSACRGGLQGKAGVLAAWGGVSSILGPPAVDRAVLSVGVRRQGHWRGRAVPSGAGGPLLWVPQAEPADSLQPVTERVVLMPSPGEVWERQRASLFFKDSSVSF